MRRRRTQRFAFFARQVLGKAPRTSVVRSILSDAEQLAKIGVTGLRKSQGYGLAAIARDNRARYGGLPLAERAALRNESIYALRDAVKLAPDEIDRWKWREMLARLLVESMKEQTDPAVLKPLAIEATGNLTLAMDATKMQKEPNDRLVKLKSELEQLIKSKNVRVP
jgi:hypothetical protein